jgi:hypothetical protein
MSSSFIFESLEPRTLFAGVTIIANGRLGQLTNDWMQDMAADLTAVEGGPSQVPEYILTVTANSNTGALQASIAQVAGTATPQSNTTGEIIVLIDYYTVSYQTNYPSNYIGQTVADCLMTNPVNGILLTSLPIHEIGVSRGAAILDGVSQTLGQAGIWVDQETYLDPDPIAAQGDPANTVYDNVAFADDYWRNDGSASQENDGNPIDGAYNLNVQWLDSEDAGWDNVHLTPAGYYIGTIDPSATTAGDGPIYSDWYGNPPTMPDRNATGWIYSDQVGAPRPLSGVWAASGGTGDRTPAGQDGTQWGNVTDLAVTSGSSVIDGNSIQASYLQEDRGGTDNVTFFLDSDLNPCNGFAAQIGSVTLPQSATVTNQTVTLSTAGVAPGSYWLCAQVTNSVGDIRYAYNNIDAPLTVVPVGSISGQVVNDVKGDGTIAPGDLGVPGVLVYVDVNDSGEYQAGDPSATTNASGDYSISGLVAGTPVIINEVVPGGMRQSAGPSEPLTPSSATVVTANFAVTQTAQVGGAVVLQSVPNEPASDTPGGFELILTEPSARGKSVKFVTYSNSTGDFAFNGIAPSVKVSVRIVPHKGYKLPPHTSATRSLIVTGGDVVSSLSFSEVPIVPPTHHQKADR